jgi:hypothetical protein
VLAFNCGNAKAFNCSFVKLSSEDEEVAVDWLELGSVAVLSDFWCDINTIPPIIAQRAMIPAMNKYKLRLLLLSYMSETLLNTVFHFQENGLAS